MASKQRPGTSRNKKAGRVGTGGNGRQALEGKGPTPRAEERKGHPAQKAAERRERFKTTGAKAVSRKGEYLAPTARTAGTRGAAGRNESRSAKASDTSEVLSGRNSVLEALRAKVPATGLFLATRIEMDDRRNRVEKGKAVLTGFRHDAFGKVGRGQWTRGDDDGAVGGNDIHTFAHDVDIWIIFQMLGDGF